MIRYNYRSDNPWFGNGFVQHSKGIWVKYDDVQSIDAGFAECIAENARLKAEVERLRKAGDAMLPFFVYPPYEKGSHKAVLNWNAAKEGKPSV